MSATDAIHIDFDAMWAEADAATEPPTIKVRGAVVPLRHGMPVRLNLMVKAARAEGRDLNTEEAVEFVGALAGPERVQAWLDDGMTLAELYSVAMSLARLYAGRS